MSEQAAVSPPKAPRSRDAVRDSLVVVCMTVVALALGIGLHLQFNMAFWLAVVAALSVYVALLTAHVLIRRSEHLDELQREVARLEARLGRQQSPAQQRAARASAPTQSGLPALSDSGPTLASAATPLPPAATSSGGSLEDYWKFKPQPSTASPAPAEIDKDPVFADQRPSMSLPKADGVAPVEQPMRTEAAAPRDLAAERAADAAQINAVIKKIAADITHGQARMSADNSAEQPSLTMPVSPAEGPRMSEALTPPMASSVASDLSRVASHIAAPRLTPPKLPAQVPAAAPSPMPPAGTAADIDESVAALHAAADAMREAGRAFEQVRLNPDLAAAGRVAPPPLPRQGDVARIDPAHAQLAAVAEALERERFDVLLQPILGLADHRAQHYVVLVRMRDGVGGDTSQLTTTGFAPGSGLLPLLDACKIDSAARVAWRMEDRAKSGSLFSQLSGESLVSDRFLNRFADTYRQGDTLGSRLVLSFRQFEVRLFSEQQWATLRDMADLGFRFCLDEITDLDIDLAGLGAAGFTFVRLDAPAFMDGLMAEGGIIPAAEICQHFADLNLTVIIGGIGDRAVAERLQSYGVQLGLGDLFGTPRAVKTDVLRNPHAAAVA